MDPTSISAGNLHETVAELRRSLEARTAELGEARAQQSATAEVLQIINTSSGDLAPVFDAILTNAHHLCGAPCGSLQLYEGDRVVPVAIRGMPPAFEAFLRRGYPITDGVREGLFANHPVQHPDMAEVLRSLPDEPSLRAARELGGIRTMLTVPLVKDGATFGRIVAGRQEVQPFSDRQIALLQDFAAQAVIAIENMRLFQELRARTRDVSESLQQQTATADVLKVISRSVFDLQTVLDTLVESAYKLCGASLGLLYLRGEEAFECKAIAGEGVAAASSLFKGRPIRAGRGTAAERVIMTGEVQSVTDFFADPEFDPRAREVIGNAAASGSSVGKLRSTLAVPMTRDDTVVGVLVIARPQTGPFPQRQIELLQTFADQAVIAIENVRLFDEVEASTEDLSESLQQQTATADVLKVISRSTFDLQPVLDTLVQTAARICDAEMAFIYRRDGEYYRTAAAFGMTPEYELHMQTQKLLPGRDTLTGRAALERRVVHIDDLAADPEYALKETVSLGQVRTALGVPLLREGNPIGVFALARREVRPFTAKQIELVTTFADQAVIAIENTRLLTEQREALEQQTATAEVLKVISRSAFDLQTVLNTLVESAMNLCGGHTGSIFQKRGDLFYMTAGHGYSPDVRAYARDHPITPGLDSNVGRVALTGKVSQIPDVLADPDYQALGYQRVANYRAMLGVPIMRDGRVEGVFSLARPEAGPFTERQIELVQTFADQAVIAIENARLFDEVQARTRELTESLQFQTATSDVLKVISRSAFDLQSVFDTLTASATQLCEADYGIIFLRRDDVFYAHATSGARAEFLEFLKANPRRLSDKSIVPRVARAGTVVHIPDRLLDKEWEFTGADRALGSIARTLLGVPLSRNGTVEGVFVVSRYEPKPFTQRQIELVESFSDQAVIAIENVRLFDQVQARTRELAASLDDLRTAQDRLVQTEKLASLGQLTAGIAHEIKNPLNFVNNFAALSAELTDELNEVLSPVVVLDGKTREEVDEITQTLKDNLQKVVQHGKRADSIVKNMLLHSREGSGEHRPADINALLDESLNLAYHGARAEKPQFNVTLQRNLDPDAGLIKVFPQEITRVFLNLISNGFYAVTKRKAENGGSDFEPVVSATTRNLGDAVEVRIRDNGTGIPAEVKEKMFNPFFTTKPAGEGTGLGLSMSHDIIVKQHGGTIDVETEPGQFTEFRIVLSRTSNPSNRNRGQT